MPPPVTLPPELDELLRPLTYALVTTGSTLGPVLIAKAPWEDIDACRGPRKIILTNELHEYPGGPVLRLVLTIEDPASGPLVLETFCNIAELDQLADWRSLLAADELRLVFFDEQHRCRLGKLIPQAPDADRAAIIPRALEILARTDPRELDFTAAKAACMAANPI